MVVLLRILGSGGCVIVLLVSLVITTIVIRDKDG